MGASLEFEDHRHYAIGDDLRHVDWRVMARTDDVLVRVHREEVQPRVDLVLDASRSMATEPEKAQALADLGALLFAAATGAGLALRCFVLGSSVDELRGDELQRHGVHFTGTAALPEALQRLAPRLSPGSLRVIVSDFLVEGTLGLTRLAHDAGGVALVQLLGPWEASPEVGERARLIDAEVGARRDLVLDERRVARYRARLEALVEAVAGEARRVGGRYARVVAGSDLRAMARAELLPARILDLAHG